MLAERDIQDTDKFDAVQGGRHDRITNKKCRLEVFLIVTLDCEKRTFDDDARQKQVQPAFAR